MKIFPSTHEKALAISIVAFCVGMIIGLFSNSFHIKQENYLPALATLISAFLGAWIAFTLESKARMKEVSQKQLQYANRVLYLLLDRFSKIKLFQLDIIDPVRDSDSLMVSMRPVLDFVPEIKNINIEDLVFLVKTKHKKLLLDLNVLDEKFRETIKLIRYRSELHLNVYQPSIERAGFTLGQELTSEDIHNAIGDRNYEMLRQFSERVVTYVDGFLEDGMKIKEEFVSAIKELYPNDEILNFVLKENI